MHFGRLKVQFVKKGQRVCANMARILPRSCARLLRSFLLAPSIPVPREDVAPILALAVANEERLARA
jgi:hypothetical protein